MGGRTPLFSNHSPKIKSQGPGSFAYLKCYHTQLVTFSCTEMLEGNLGI